MVMLQQVPHFESVALDYLCSSTALTPGWLSGSMLWLEKWGIYGGTLISYSSEVQEMFFHVNGHINLVTIPTQLFWLSFKKKRKIIV